MSDEISRGLLPLDIILQEPRGYSYAKWLGQHDFSHAAGDDDKFQSLQNISSEFQTRFIEKVTGYQVSYEKIVRDTNPDVICTIFETINTTGVKLTVFDLLVAKCFKSKVYLRDMLNAAVESKHWINIYDPEGKNLAPVHLPRILGQLIKRECKKGVILDLDALDIKARWSEAISGLDKAFQYLSERYGAITPEFIPSGDIITPLAVILADDRFNSRHFESLDKWYWRSVFGQYLSGAPESKIARTLRDIQGPEGWLSGGKQEPDAVENFAFRPSALDEATKNSSVYKGLFTLMLASRPYDIGPEGHNLFDLPRNDIHDHHVFPQSFLRDIGIKGAKANQILNRMPIWRKSNERIGSNAPNVYLANPSLTGQGAAATLRDKFSIDPDRLNEEFFSELFELFLQDRRSHFLEAIANAVSSTKDEMIVKEEV